MKNSEPLFCDNELLWLVDHFDARLSHSYWIVSHCDMTIDYCDWRVDHYDGTEKLCEGRESLW